MTQIKTAYARTALKIGLESLGLSDGTKILIPDYICEAVLHPFQQLGIHWRYYGLNDDLSPDWPALDKLALEGTEAILMVHYFGQPQDINRFRALCDKHGMILLEDNAHGYGGHFEGKPLGSFGDIGISSPRKTLGLNSGGILHWNRKDITNPDVILAQSQINDLGYFRAWLRRHPQIKAMLCSAISNKYQQPHYWDPNASREETVDDLGMDRKSSKLLDLTNIKSIASYRRIKYSKLENKAINWGLKPVFKTLQPEACPWCFPAYSTGPEDSRYWFDWGWRKGINVHSWPTLPQEQVRDQGRAFERWQRLICFPINSII